MLLYCRYIVYDFIETIDKYTFYLRFVKFVSL